jgi:hypothetical protein
MRDDIWIQVIAGRGETFAVTAEYEILEGETRTTVPVPIQATEPLRKTTYNCDLFDTRTTFPLVAILMNVSDRPVEVGACQTSNYYSGCMPSVLHIMAPRSTALFATDSGVRWLRVSFSGPSILQVSDLVSRGFTQTFDSTSVVSVK